MRFKEEKGIAGTDIAISVIIVTIFMALLGNLIVNINLNSADVERKTTATSYAIQEIEKIKVLGITPYISKGIVEEEKIEEDIMEKDNNNQDVFSGYHKTITIKDYVLLKPDNVDKQQDILKEITVEISYKLRNQDEKVQFTTYVTKE